MVGEILISDIVLLINLSVRCRSLLIVVGPSIEYGSEMWDYNNLSQTGVLESGGAKKNLV